MKRFLHQKNLRETGGRFSTAFDSLGLSNCLVVSCCERGSFRYTTARSSIGSRKRPRARQPSSRTGLSGARQTRAAEGRPWNPHSYPPPAQGQEQGQRRSDRVFASAGGATDQGHGDSETPILPQFAAPPPVIPLLAGLPSRSPRPRAKAGASCRD